MGGGERAMSETMTKGKAFNPALANLAQLSLPGQHIGRAFLFAGNAIFTVSNPEGKRYTYRVKQAAKRREGEAVVWFVGMLAGPNNHEDFRYLGLVTARGEVKHGHRSTWPEDSEAWKVAAWAIRLVMGDKAPPSGYRIQHAGYCGRCGRMLTVPESIESGLGPECQKILAGGM
jgi:hypothetical protein